ncbi:MAG: glycosyltransferase [Lachnospiraceae bacterium]|nr:glycosyltransferase [Lachnospiraceae bacterium]
MKKKLIFASEALWVGGIETALVNLLNRLDYDKYDVTCLIVRDYQEMASRITPNCRLLIADRQHTVTFKESYKYSRLFNLMEEPQNASSARRLIWKALCLFLKAPEMRMYSKYIRKQLAGEHFDTCIIYSDRTAELAVRGIDADKYLMFYHHGSMKREYHDSYGYKKSEQIIAVSQGVANNLKKEFPQFRDKIIVIHNLTDIEGIREKAKEVHDDLFPEAGFNIVSCGRLHHVKGYDLAIQACDILLKRGYDQIHWYIVGGGPEEANLRQQIKELHLEEHVHLYGMKSNPYPYIKAGDLFVQPSRVEAYGLTIIEALALGVPVVATNTAGATEIADILPNVALCNADAIEIAQLMEQHINNTVTIDNRHVCQSLKKVNENTLKALNGLL